MARSVVSRLCILVCLAAPVAALSPEGKSLPSIYAHVATLPNVIGGQSLRSFAFDRAANRLYAGSNLGLYWVGAGEERPVWKGPMFRANIRHIEFAPEIGRVFFSTSDELGYVSVDALESPRIFAQMRTHDFVYEPSRQEIYAAYRAPKIQVFDARSGERSGAVELPSWYGQSLEAIPGRVFLTLPTESGLFAIDAASHHIGAWPVSGKIVTPGYLEADPAGKYLFLSYYQNVVAIDTSTAEVVGRISSGATPAIAFDPVANLLITTFVYGPPPYTVGAYRVDASGLTQVGAMRNPALGAIGVEPTGNGFVQSGQHSLLLWSLTRTR